MKRIGLAASKIAQGNVWFYNLAVVIITVLFAFFVFFICGFIIGIAIFALSLIAQHGLHLGNGQTWLEALRICLILLGILVGIGALVGIIINIKLRV